MAKKGKSTENTNQKLSLAIRSGKHQVGKYFIPDNNKHSFLTSTFF